MVVHFLGGFFCLSCEKMSVELSSFFIKSDDSNIMSERLISTYTAKEICVCAVVFDKRWLKPDGL